MPYSHYGKYADVWKHIALAEALRFLRPSQYIESNSAYAEYHLQGTPAQLHGIYHLLRAATEIPVLFKTPYFDIQSKAFKGEASPTYVGSPGIAVSQFQSGATAYVFHDADPSALESIAAYGRARVSPSRVNLVHGDSRTHLARALCGFSERAFIFFDPYELDEPDSFGVTYWSLFLATVDRSLPCALWYGFDSLEERTKLLVRLRQHLSNATQSLFEASVFLSDIKTVPSPSNPGVLGSGMLFSGLPASACDSIMEICHALTSLYESPAIDDLDFGSLSAVGGYV
jgi:23S rRNA (adenine2030-N6)-methyltransferase